MDPMTWMAISMGASTLLDALLSNKRYPKEMEAFIRQLSVRGNELLNSPGFSTEEVAALFGKEFENVRGQGKNVRESTAATLGAAGMSGTGTAVKAAQQDAWANENLVTNAIRDVLIAKKAAKQQDQALATQMAQTAVGAEAGRVEKGPDFTGMVTTLAMMGMFDQPAGGGGGLGGLIQEGASLAGTQGYGGIKSYVPSKAMRWADILGGSSGIPWGGGKSLFGGGKSILGW
jgi:hypothetical protein